MTKEGQNKTALITGASAGIGKALANEFAANGFNVVLVARRLDKLEEVAKEINSKHGVEATTISADLSKVSAPKKLYDTVKEQGIEIDALVNNAGYALNTAFTEASWKQHQDFINVMMTSLTQLCYLFSKDMKARKYGRILNVSSIAAFAPEWEGSLYGPIKSYVRHFSEALDLELKKDNVYCMALCPGFTYSEFHDVMGVRSAMNKLPKLLWMDAETVAKQGYKALMKGEIRYINGLVNKTVVTAFELLPKQVRYMISKSQNVI